MVDYKSLQIAVAYGRNIRDLLLEYVNSIDEDSPRFWEQMAEVNEFIAELYQQLYLKEKEKRIALEEKYGTNS